MPISLVAPEQARMLEDGAATAPVDAQSTEDGPATAAPDDAGGASIRVDIEGNPMPEFAEEELLRARHCYICKARFRKLHHFYDKLCPECAVLNYNKRTQVVDLSNRIILLTGGRVKIGYRAALKLLRCGATVIVTTRFPADATRRCVHSAPFSR